MLLSAGGIAFGESFAQVTPPDGLDPWLKAGVAVVSLAALIWVVQHLLRYTIPEQQRTFQQTMDKICEKSERIDLQNREALHEITDKCAQTQQRWLDRAKE